MRLSLPSWVPRLRATAPAGEAPAVPLNPPRRPVRLFAAQSPRLQSITLGDSPRHGRGEFLATLTAVEQPRPDRFLWTFRGDGGIVQHLTGCTVLPGNKLHRLLEYVDGLDASGRPRSPDPRQLLERRVHLRVEWTADPETGDPRAEIVGFRLYSGPGALTPRMPATGLVVPGNSPGHPFSSK